MICRLVFTPQHNLDWTQYTSPPSTKHQETKLLLNQQEAMNSEICPKCKYDSVRLVKGTRKCASPGCHFVQFSPITYENDVRNFDGEKTVENRFAMPYNADLDNGGLMFEFEGKDAQELNQAQWSKESKQTRDYKEAQKMINKWGDHIKISQRIQELGIIRYSQISKVCDKLGKCSKKELVAYALYNAACQEEEYFIDVKLIKRASIPPDVWEKVKREMNKALAGLIYVPKEPPTFYALRYCRDNNINKIEKETIIRLLKQFKEQQLQGGEKESTVAACAIWMVLKVSERYADVPGFSVQQIAAEFDNKTELTVKKFYDKNVAKPQKLGDIVVKFEGMISKKSE